MVLFFGLVQWKANVRFSDIQILLGINVVGINTYLGIRAATLGYGEVSAIYYLSYFSLAIGLAILGVGLAQRIKG